MDKQCIYLTWWRLERGAKVFNIGTAVVHFVTCLIAEATISLSVAIRRARKSSTGTAPAQTQLGTEPESA